METVLLPISRVFPNIGQVVGLPKNPRFIRDDKYKRLLQSIKDDPEMLELRELIVYDTGSEELGYVVAGGNMRYRAMKELGYKDVPCKVLHAGFPMEKLRRIVLKDNSAFGDTDFAALVEEWGLDEIELAAIDVPDIYFPSDALEDGGKAAPSEGKDFDVVGERPQQRTESKGEVDVSQFEVKQTLKLDFTPDEYIFVLDKLREYGDDYPQALLFMLGYIGEEGERDDG